MFSRFSLPLSLAILLLCPQVYSAVAIDIAPVWAGHPVDFALLTDPDHDIQYVAFYDAQRHLTVASRSLKSSTWKMFVLPSKTDHPSAQGATQPSTILGWDSHNSIAIALDSNNELHLAGNMHASPLLYCRASVAGVVTSMQEIDRMVGDRESSATYPRFFPGPSGELIFAYRDGRSGNGADVYDQYDAKLRAWSRLIDQPLLDGRGKMNAYSTGPIKGPDGYYHLAWVWRNSPDCSSCHDVSYARSRDLLHWESSAGQPISLPITIDNGDVVDAVPPRGGAINTNVLIGFDAQNHVLIAYTKYDSAGNSQLYLARRDAGQWKISQLSRWDYRWNFAGNGTIVFEITFTPPRALPDGRILVTYNHVKFGRGGFAVDPQTLSATPIDPPPRIPLELLKPESDFPGMEARFAEDSGTSGDPHMRYLLRWETLPENRDRMRTGPLPPPSMLRVYEVTE